MLVHIHPALYRFTSKTRSVSRLRINRYVRLCVRVAPVPDPPSAQSPFARCKVLPRPSGCLAPRQQALPRLHRSYGLMRQSYALLVPRCYPCTLGLRRLLPAPAGRGTLSGRSTARAPVAEGFHRHPFRAVVAWVPSSAWVTFP